MMNMNIYRIYETDRDGTFFVGGVRAATPKDRVTRRRYNGLVTGDNRAEAVERRPLSRDELHEIFTLVENMSGISIADAVVDVLTRSGIAEPE